MRFFAICATVAFLLGAPVFSIPRPALKSIQSYSGTKTGQYIVKLKPGTARKDVARKVQGTNTVEWDLINGFSGSFSDDALTTLRASDDVEYIAEDGIMHTMEVVTQLKNAPWGLQRISEPDRIPNTAAAAIFFNYTYDDPLTPPIDTGIRLTHTQFEGRARWGATFGVNGTTDDHGHGTHCAGTAASNRFGVAKKANLIAVKVLGADGTGTTAGIISGLDWISQQVAASGRPSVVSMSLGGGASQPLDDAVTQLTREGIHVTVAAGNGYRDVGNTSPARTPAAITVGASTIRDEKADFSNYGPVVDVFASGETVLSTYFWDDNAIRSSSGTSMATPHVAGVVAYIISRDGNIPPPAMEAKIKEYAVKDVLTGVPEGTANNLLQLGPV